MKKLKIIASFLITGAFFTACKEEITECDIDGAICTELFKVVSVEVKDESDQPILLDSISVVKSGTSEVLFTENPTSTNGVYKLISDTEINDIVKEGTDVTFYGYSNDSQIISENYKVGHDCCHVVFLSGVQVLILE
jgi:hypothetical protein|tara:strand:+ start:186 stop:596 length:411 start_codon:yes stop_codon:yes gene_type:complete